MTRSLVILRNDRHPVILRNGVTKNLIGGKNGQIIESRELV